MGFFLFVRGPVRAAAVAGIVAGNRVSASDIRGRSDRGQIGGSDDVRPAFEGAARLLMGIGQRAPRGRIDREDSNTPRDSRRRVEFHRKSARTNDRRIIHHAGGSATASAVARILAAGPFDKHPAACAGRRARRPVKSAHAVNSWRGDRWQLSVRSLAGTFRQLPLVQGHNPRKPRAITKAPRTTPTKLPTPESSNGSSESRLRVYPTPATRNHKACK